MYERTGTLSCQEIPRPHAGQAERGRTTESRRGRRWMQTFRNEPTQAPAAITKNHRITFGMCGTPARSDLPSQDQAAAVADRPRLRIVQVIAVLGVARQRRQKTDRKSTRLNSSHMSISY